MGEGNGAKNTLSVESKEKKKKVEREKGLLLRDTELYTWFGTYYKAIYSANPCFINPCFVAHVDALA